LPLDPQPDMLYIVIDGTGVLATGKETAERDDEDYPVRRHHHPPLPAGQQTQDRIWQAPCNQIGAA
jgi:hypothetical protein